jgi:hypothetical protein
VKIDGDNLAYWVIGSVLDSVATSGKTVRTRNQVFVENVIMASQVAILLKWGYTDNVFTARGTTSMTVIDGSLKIRRGTLRADRLSIR